MTKIYLIRHAEAEGNLYRRVQGHCDGQVTALGRCQIEALALRFKDIPLSAIYSSDWSRTLATAGALTKHHALPIISTPRLREVNMGIWEDRPWGDVTHDQMEQYNYFSNDPDKWDIEGCEKFRDLTQRIRSAVTDLAGRHDGQTIAIVSHGMAIRSLLCDIMDIPSHEVSRIAHGDNTCVSLLRLENGRLTVEFYNDNSHLSGGLSTFAKQTWWKNKESIDEHNLRFLPVINSDRDFYISCYRDAWIFAHGSDKGFSPGVYWQSARYQMNLHPCAVMKAMSGGRAIGIIHLDTERAAEDGCGWVSFCYVLPEYRGLRLGIQLIGHAVSLFKSMGRSALRLHVAETNTAAQDFYIHHGFRAIGTDEGVASTMLLMQKDFAAPSDKMLRVVPLELADCLPGGKA